MVAKQKRKVHTPLKKFIAGVSLVSLFVVVIGGILADARVTTITIRACMAMLGIAFIGRIAHRILSNYEEMHGGQG